MVLRPSTATAIPSWGDTDEPGMFTVRLTTTPGPPVASMVVVYVSLAGRRVSVLVGITHVVPGNTLSVSGANGPDGNRNRTVTASVD